MGWIKIMKEEEIGKYRDYDIVVKKKYIYFPLGSKIYKYVESSNIWRYNLYIDRDRGMLGFEIAKDGKYAFPVGRLIRNPSKYKLHTVVRYANEILGIGKYVAKVERIDGNVLFAVGGEEDGD